ncbi:zinc finger CCCH domain-containing 6 [Paramuricea clavata]|uniref:Zinc finger CCCH domain-containing 6 n=1 Tax=Paramuricea clavata TaxID=317549 RepID=A0A7D9HC60_PARCT|nr:zinc finger CCCH domain-containing 6 [Paramuricea clavata]
MDIKPEPATVRMSSHDLVINIDSENETLSKDINEKGCMNLSATDKQSNVNDSKTDIKPDIVTLNPDSSKQGNANTFVTVIKPDFVSINTDSSEAAKQDNDSKQEPTTVSPASSDLVVAIDSGAGGQRPSQSSPRQHNDILENSQVKDQFKTDVKQNPVPQSPGSPSGDLFIDMDSDTELSTRATRRAKERERYSSLTSESSSEEQKVSSFDWIRNLSEKLSNCVEKNMQEEATNSTTPPENDNTPSGNNDIRPKNTKQSGRKDNLPTAAQRQTSLVTTNTFPNKDIDVKGKNVFEEKQAGRDKKDTRVSESLKRKEFDDESRNKTGKRKQNHKGIPSTNRQQSYTGRVTRSMSHSDVESGYTDENRTSLERPQGSGHNSWKRNSPGKQQGTRHRNDQRRSSRDWQEKASNTDQNRRASFPRAQETSSKNEQRPHPSSERSRRRSPPPQRQHEPRGQHASSRERQKETNNNNQRKRSPPGNRSQGRQPSYELSKGASHGNEKRRHSPRGEERSSLERQEKSVVIVKENVGAPSLLSMLSNDTFDVTVAQQELSDQRKNNKRGGKKKKKKKPSAWFLRQIQKEKEMREKGQQPRRQVPRERLLPCLYYRGGKCSKGATCQFKHEKIKELCRFYVTRVCDKHPDGMCPRMHEEFPCTFFHTRNHCSSGNTCKYSHAPLTDETREILEKYVTEMAQRRQALDHPVINTASEQISVIAPIQENNGPSTSSNLTTAMNSNPGPSHGTNPNIVGFSTASKPGVGLNPASITPPLRKYS